MPDTIRATYFESRATIFPREGSTVSFSIANEPLPIMQAQISYVLNGIGRASVILTPGTALDGSGTSPLQEVIEEIGPELEMTIEILARGAIDETENWPDEWFEVFRGPVMGVTTTMQFGKRSVQITAAQWLARLAEGTVISPDIAPSSYDSLTANAITTVDGLSTSAVPIEFTDESSPIWSGLFLPSFENVLGRPGNQSDLAFRETLVTLASLGGETAGQVGWLDSITAGNETALAILNGNTTPGFNLADAITVADPVLRGGTQSLALEIAVVVGQFLTDQRSRQTVFDKLTGLLDPLMLSLVSNAGSATVAPATAAYPDDLAYKTLNPASYTLIGGRVAADQVIAGLGLYQIDAPTIADIESRKALLAGAYIAEGIRGKLRVEQAPPWLLIRPDYRDRAAAIADPQPAPGGAGLTGDDDFAGSLIAGSGLAQELWAFDYFGRRTASVATPLRLDICPGSFLAIDGSGFVGIDEDARRIFGVVQQVNITISSQAKTAQTTFEVGYIRTEAESQYVSENGHPVYSEYWTGSEIVRVGNA